MRTRPAAEIARLGKEIYERDIRRQVESECHGEYVAIDVDTGSWALSNDLRTAAKSLRKERPDAMHVWLLRVGHRALHHFGGRPAHSPRHGRTAGTDGLLLRLTPLRKLCWPLIWQGRRCGP